MIIGITGWELIRLLIFLESRRCWLWDKRNLSNTSIPSGYTNKALLGSKFQVISYPFKILAHFRLMRMHQRINVVSFPLICMQIVILSLPSQEMPFPVCSGFEWMNNFLWLNRNHCGLSFALGR